MAWRDGCTRCAVREKRGLACFLDHSAQLKGWRCFSPRHRVVDEGQTLEGKSGVRKIRL